MTFRPTLLLLALLAAGCATAPREPGQSDAATYVVPPAAPAQAADGAAAAGRLPAGSEPARSGAPAVADDASLGNRVYLGDDRVFNPSGKLARDPVLSQGDRVSLNFENVTVSSLAAALLGDLLKLSYTIDAGGDVTVSLRTQKPLPRAQVLDVLDAVLQPHDLVISRDNVGVYHLTKRSATAGSRPVVGASRVKDLAGSGTVIVPLNYISAAEMAKILGPLAPKDAIVYVDSLRNLLVLQGSKAQLTGWLDMVEAFDVDYFSGMSLGVYVLENANVSSVYDTLMTMLSSGDGAAASVYGGAAGGRGAAGGAGVGGGALAPGASGAGAQGGTMYGLVRLIPLERLNALVAVSPRSHLLSQVETWVRRLDQPSDSLEPTLFVYPVQNGSASHMAQMLNGLFGGGNASGGGGGVASGSAPSQFGSAAGSGISSSTNALGQVSLKTTIGGGTSTGTTGTFGAGVGGQNAANTAGAQTTTVTFGANVRVVADESRNALLIRAPRVEYRRIEKALRELDKAPTQVLIEASIVEVTLTGALKYGVEWYIENGLGNDRTGQALLNMNSSGGIGAKQPGFSYTIVNKAGTVRAAINALAQKSMVNVLSNPSVLVLDNHNATIQVGNQQPIKSATTVSSTTGTTESITYKDTGVILSVTPSVNSGGLITMDVAQQVTDVGSVDDATGQRAFLTRQIQSRVAVRSGETIVLGGLIRENTSRGRNGVPVLGDVPLLGSLFSTTNNTSDRTELLVLLTPRALEDDDQLRAASVELRQRMRGVSLRDLREGENRINGAERGQP